MCNKIHVSLRLCFPFNIFSNSSYYISPLPESSTSLINCSISIGKSNSFLIILTSTSPSICPDLSYGPPIAV